MSEPELTELFLSTSKVIPTIGVFVWIYNGKDTSSIMLGYLSDDGHWRLVNGNWALEDGSVHSWAYAR